MVLIKNPLTIIQGGSPTPTVEEKDINFYDYDGTLVASWTKAELANKAALPDNPSHTGLTAQGWNWDLAVLKTSGLNKIDVGQNYIPTDGKTHIFVSVDANNLASSVKFGVNGTVTVNWGDGTSTSSVSGTSATTVKSLNHTYSQAGDYEVTLDVGTGSGKICNLVGNVSHGSSLWTIPSPSGSSVLASMMNKYKQVKEIWIGERVGLGIGNQANAAPFAFLSVEKISLPNTLSIGNGSFKNCTGVKFLAFPKNLTLSQTISDGAFFKCWNLEHIALPSLSSQYANIIYQANAFYGCTSLKRVGIQFQTLKANICCNCPSLEEVYFSTPVTGTIATQALYTALDGIPSRLTVLDFTKNTTVPTLADATTIPNATQGLVIKVPSSLLNNWKSSWSAYANYIVGV